MSHRRKIPTIRISERRGNVVLNYRFEGTRHEKWIGPASPRAYREAEAQKGLILRMMESGDLRKVLEQERRARQEVRHQKQIEPWNQLTFGELVQRYTSGYIESPTSGRRGRGLKDTRCASKRADLLADEFGDRLVKDMTREVVEAFKARRAVGRTGGTVNRYLALLSHIFNWAIETKNLPDGFVNPVRGVRRLAETEPGDEFFASEQEAEAVLQACPLVLRRIVVFARNTGMRRGELLSVTWSQVNRRSRVIELRADQTKNGYARRVPINDTALAVLDALPRAIDPKQPLFVHEDGRPILGDWVTKRFKKALRKAGATGVRRFHGIRHDAASQLVMSGRSLEQVGRVLGHRSPIMTQRYSHLSAEVLLDVAKTLDARPQATGEGGNLTDNLAKNGS